MAAMATDERKDENNQIKEKLRRSYSTIVASIDPCPGIANKLFEDGVITIDQLQDIKRPDDSGKRAEQLLYILYKTQHPSVFISFKDAIRLSGEYNWIIELIDEKSTGNTPVAGKLANLKLENDNDAGSTKKRIEAKSSYNSRIPVPAPAGEKQTKVVRTLSMKQGSFEETSNASGVRSPKSRLEVKRMSKSMQVKLPASGNVQGITSWNDELYVVILKSPDIDVYDIDTLAHRRKIRVEGLVNGFDIVAHANVLYVCEWNAEMIHRIQLPDETSSNWSVDSKYLTMSINKEGNIVVSCWNTDKIVEYTPTGSLVREIRVNAIDRTICDLNHAIQLNDDRFLICHASATIDRVCIIDSDGRKMKSYGGRSGSRIGQMNEPGYLAIDRNGSILVADFNNNRIIQLDTSLELVREFIPESNGMKKPFRMHLDENARRLYIAESYEQNIAIFDLLIEP